MAMMQWNNGHHHFQYEIHLHSGLVFHCHVCFGGCRGSREHSKPPPGACFIKEFQQQQTYYYPVILEDSGPLKRSLPPKNSREIDHPNSVIKPQWLIANRYDSQETGCEAAAANRSWRAPSEAKDIWPPKRWCIERPTFFGQKTMAPWDLLGMVEWTCLTE